MAAGQAEEHGFVESASRGPGYGDQVALELARLREALDDLRRRPIPPDAASLRNVVTASLSEASAPPPNLLVTAIRRLDRVDARLESIESLLGGSGALPRGGAGQAAVTGRGRPVALAPAPVGYGAPPPDPEAIADALARRLASVLAAQAPVAPTSGGVTVDDLMVALRPLLPEAARSVLRRAGREPSPQAVEVLQQTALTALEEAAESLGPYAAPPAGPPAAPDRRFAPPAALAPGPAAAPAPPPPPVDVDALAAAVAARVAGSLAGQLHPPPPPPPIEQPVRPPEPEPAPPPAPPPVDPAVVADAVIARLAQQPPPQAVVSPMAMAPLLSAVGNVEAAVARLADPENDVGVAVDRLEAGVGALARALEEDRATQVEEVRRGFAEVNQLVRAELAAQLTTGGDSLDTFLPTDGEPEAQEEGDGSGAGPEPAARALVGLQRRVDRLTAQLAPLGDADLGSVVPGLAVQGERLERSLSHILTALAAMAEHLHEQSATWRAGFDDLRAGIAAAADAGTATGDLDGISRDLGRLASRVDDLATGTGADRQRFQRLGGTIDGLAEMLGEVSERLDRLPRALDPAARFAAAAGLSDGSGTTDVSADGVGSPGDQEGGSVPAGPPLEDGGASTRAAPELAGVGGEDDEEGDEDEGPGSSGATPPLMTRDADREPDRLVDDAAAGSAAAGSVHQGADGAVAEQHPDSDDEPTTEGGASAVALEDEVAVSDAEEDEGGPEAEAEGDGRPGGSRKRRRGRRRSRRR